MIIITANFHDGVCPSRSRADTSVNSNANIAALERNYNFKTVLEIELVSTY